MSNYFVIGNNTSPNLILGVNSTSGFIQSVSSGAATLSFNPSGGNVGIGSASPYSFFTVKSSYSGGTTGGFCLDANDGTAYRLFLYPYVQGGGQVAYQFNTQNAGTTYTSLVLGYNGNVGIGTTIPGYKLDVNGAINSGAITCTSINTQNNSISAGSGALGCGALTCTTISSNNYFIMSGNGTGGVGDYGRYLSGTFLWLQGATSRQYIYTTSADGASYGVNTNNLVIQSWYGLGFADLDGNARSYINCRTGDIYGNSINTASATINGALTCNSISSPSPQSAYTLLETLTTHNSSFSYTNQFTVPIIVFAYSTCGRGYIQVFFAMSGIATIPGVQVVFIDAGSVNAASGSHTVLVPPGVAFTYTHYGQGGGSLIKIYYIKLF